MLSFFVKRPFGPVATFWFGLRNFGGNSFYTNYQVQPSVSSFNYVLEFCFLSIEDPGSSPAITVMVMRLLDQPPANTRCKQSGAENSPRRASFGNRFSRQ
jgi:hypothetical protein